MTKHEQEQEQEPETAEAPEETTPRTPKDRIERLESDIRSLKEILANHGIHF